MSSRLQSLFDAIAIGLALAVLFALARALGLGSRIVGRSNTHALGSAVIDNREMYI